MSTPTPETDAAFTEWVSLFDTTKVIPCAAVPTEFARKLERERDEARRIIKCYEPALVVIQERDELRAQVAALREALENIAAFSDERIQQVQEMHSAGTVDNSDSALSAVWLIVRTKATAALTGPCPPVVRVDEALPVLSEAVGLQAWSIVRTLITKLEAVK